MTGEWFWYWKQLADEDCEKCEGRGYAVDVHCKDSGSESEPLAMSLVSTCTACPCTGGTSEH